VLEDGVRVRFEVKDKSILFICTDIIVNLNKNWLPCDILASVVTVSHWPKSVGFGSVWGKNHSFGRFRFSASAVNCRRRS